MLATELDTSEIRTSSNGQTQMNVTGCQTQAQFICGDSDLSEMDELQI